MAFVCNPAAIVLALLLWAYLGADGRVLRSSVNVHSEDHSSKRHNTTQEKDNASMPLLQDRSGSEQRRPLVWQTGFNGTFQLSNGSWNPAFSFARSNKSVEDDITFQHPGRACLKPPSKSGYFCPCSCSMASDSKSEKAEVLSGASCPAPDNSNEQDRFICMWTIKNVLPELPRRNVKILHLNPDESIVYGLGLIRSPRVSQYVLGDTNVPRAHKRLPDQHITYVDVTNIPFADQTFDLVICMNVLERVPNDEKAMSELFRVMKPGGIGFVEVEMDWTKKLTSENSTARRNWPFDDIDRVHLYGQDFVDKGENAGFNVRIVNQKWWYRSLRDSIDDFDLDVLHNPEYHRNEYKTTLFTRPF